MCDGKIVVTKTHISLQASSPPSLRCLSLSLSLAFSMDVSLQLDVGSFFSLRFVRLFICLFVLVDDSLYQQISIGKNDMIECD